LLYFDGWYEVRYNIKGTHHTHFAHSGKRAHLYAQVFWLLIWRAKFLSRENKHFGDNGCSQLPHGRNSAGRHLPESLSSWRIEWYHAWWPGAIFWKLVLSAHQHGNPNPNVVHLASCTVGFPFIIPLIIYLTKTQKMILRW